MADELKDQRVVTMMSPSELAAIDDWMFSRRMRSRGEAIRRLAQLGMALDRRSMQLLEFLASSQIQKEYTQARTTLREVADRAPVEVQGNLFQAIAVSAEFEAGVLTLLYKMLIETWPIKAGIPMSEAAQLRKEFEEKLDGLPKEKEVAEILRMINILSGKDTQKAGSQEP